MRTHRRFTLLHPRLVLIEGKQTADEDEVVDQRQEAALCSYCYGLNCYINAMLNKTDRLHSWILQSTSIFPAPVSHTSRRTQICGWPGPLNQEDTRDDEFQGLPWSKMSDRSWRSVIWNVSDTWSLYSSRSSHIWVAVVCPEHRNSFQTLLTEWKWARLKPGRCYAAAMLSYFFAELLYILFLEIASMWFEPCVISANIKMPLFTSWQSATEGVWPDIRDIDTWHLELHMFFHRLGKRWGNGSHVVHTAHLHSRDDRGLPEERRKLRCSETVVCARDEMFYPHTVWLLQQRETRCVTSRSSLWPGLTMKAELMMQGPNVWKGGNTQEDSASAFETVCVQNRTVMRRDISWLCC